MEFFAWLDFMVSTSNCALNEFAVHIYYPSGRLNIQVHASKARLALSALHPASFPSARWKSACSINLAPSHTAILGLESRRNTSDSVQGMSSTATAKMPEYSEQRNLEQG
jgi:hypothetical protein